MRDKLQVHLGHEIAISKYGSSDDGLAWDVCVECLTCQEIIISSEYFDEEG